MTRLTHRRFCSLVLYSLIAFASVGLAAGMAMAQVALMKTKPAPQKPSDPSSFENRTATER